jgi:hypothetical protein
VLDDRARERQSHLAVVGGLAREASAGRQPATITYGHGRCDLAANRDYFDEERQQFVCGYNPTGPADDTVLAVKISGEGGGVLATVVNYACHPTTLAWQNTLIGPDYVGALRETMEQHTGAPCLFLQGASGDVGPREGFVGDPGIADRNGRQLGYAALAALESLPKPGTQFAYAGPVVSGAIIGTWRHVPVDETALGRYAVWNVTQWNVPLRYRPDLATAEQAQAELARWQTAEQKAVAAGNASQARDYHARVEQAHRQLWRLSALPPERFPLGITLARLGNAAWLFVPGEHYQILQTTLRRRFPQQPIVVATLTGGWQPGYIPPADIYGRGIYQEQIAVVAAGSAEEVIEAVSERMRPFQC